MNDIPNNNWLHGIEALEDRVLLTTFLVDTLADTNDNVADGFVSLREAIIAAETNAAFGDAAAGSADGDRILFASGIANGTINLIHGDFEISDDLVINGAGQNITIDAQGNSRMFTINSTENFKFSNITLTNGNEVNGGAMLLLGNGDKTLYNVSLTNSTATGDNLGQGGGGIFSSAGDLKISNSTIDGNLKVSMVSRHWKTECF